MSIVKNFSNLQQCLNPVLQRFGEELSSQSEPEKSDSQTATKWGNGFSLLPSAVREYVFNGFLTIRKAREVCKSWKGMIDVLTGVGEGKLTYNQLLSRVEKLATTCYKSGIIPVDSHTVRDHGRNLVSIGYNAFIQEAQLSYSDALNAYWHLKAREGNLTDPLNYSRLIHHVGRGDIPYVPLARPIFANLFKEKVENLNLSKEERRHCFTFYPCRKDVHEIGIYFYDVFYPINIEELKESRFDLGVYQTYIFEPGTLDERGMKIPIFFSKDEILQLKRETLRRRIKDEDGKAILDEIIKKDCFHNALDRKGAIQMLQGCPPGTYLIRPARSEKYDAVFSYTSTSGEIVHAAFVILIQKDKPQFFCELNGLLFDSPEDLIKYMSFWKNPLNRETEIRAETKEMWSYIYTLPYYFPMAKTEEELCALAKDPSQNYVFFFYDSDQQCLKMGSWFERKLITIPVDENKFTELKREVFDSGGQKNIVFLENSMQTSTVTPTTVDSSGRYARLKL